MIQICWNCRGIGAASRVKELKDLILIHKPQLVFLSETKTKANKLQAIKRRMNFDDLFVVDSKGKSGGLCLLWKKNVKVHVIYSDSNVIHAYIDYMNASIGFYYSFVYGNPSAQQRKRFWERLKNLHTQNHEPWICAGDFNELLHQSDKDGVRKHSNSQIQNFNDFLASKDMEELPQKGCRFTWCNKEKWEQFKISLIDALQIGDGEKNFQMLLLQQWPQSPLTTAHSSSI